MEGSWGWSKQGAQNISIGYCRLVLFLGGGEPGALTSGFAPRGLRLRGGSNGFIPLTLPLIRLRGGNKREGGRVPTQ